MARFTRSADARVNIRSNLKSPIGRLLIALLLCLSTAWSAAHAQDVRIGVLAKRGFEKSYDRWIATRDYLNQSLPQYRFEIVPMTFDDIGVIVRNRMVDFVIVNPGIYVDLSVKYGVRRILTLINNTSTDTGITKFGSVIFTLNDNDRIRALADIREQRLAAVHQTSLGGWIMALRELHNAGIETWDLASLSYRNTHDAVVEAVLNREADVGVVRTDTLERMAMESKIDLARIRIINPKIFEHFPYRVSTPLYPEWPFAQLTHTPQQLAKDVSIALLRLSADQPAAQQAHIKGWTIPENYQTVRDLLKLLELPPFEKSLKETLLQSLVHYWYWYLPVVLVILFLIAMSIRIVRLNRSLTEHKKTLKQSQEAQIATFEQAAVGLAHITPSGQLLNMNRRLCTITGYPFETLRQINIKELILNEDLAQVTEAFDHLRQNRQENATIQFRLRCADGTLKWCQLTLSHLPNGHRASHYLIGVIDDIHQYKQLEEEKRQAQQQTALILKVAGEGIMGLDNEGRHTFVNPAAAAILGYEIEEMLHNNSHALWHHSHADGSSYPEDACPITSVLQHGEISRSEHEIFWRKDGSAIAVEYISTPILIDGEISGAVVVFHPAAQTAESAAV